MVDQSCNTYKFCMPSMAYIVDEWTLGVFANMQHRINTLCFTTTPCTQHIIASFAQKYHWITRSRTVPITKHACKKCCTRRSKITNAQYHSYPHHTRELAVRDAGWRVVKHRAMLRAKATVRLFYVIDNKRVQFGCKFLAQTIAMCYKLMLILSAGTYILLLN